MSLPQRVTKTHATGNDFVVYLDKSGKFEPTADEVRFLCDRHFGIGGDGLIRLTRPDFVSDLSDDQLSDVLAGGTKWFMDYRNADGSLAEMCGNGTRAITLFAQREGVADSTEPFRLGTRAGVKILTPRGNMRPYGANVFQVEMGEWKIGETDAYEVTIPGTEGSARGTFVDMGNPHVVAVIEDAFASLQWLNHWIWSPNQWWLRSSNPTRTWNSCGSTTSTRTPAWVKPRCASTNVAAAKPCPAGTACAPQALCCGPRPASATGTSPYVAVPCAWTSPTAT